MEVNFEQARDVLRAGEPLIFPTDTVWGIGVAVRHADGTEALAKAKGRASSKPIAWLVGDRAALAEYGEQAPAYAHALAEVLWPGPLTLIVKASSAVPDGFRTEAGTVGLRMPAFDVALRLIESVGSPLATTSANFAGNPAVPSDEPPDANFVAAANVPILRCAESTPSDSMASTVVDCTASAPKLLRAGTISASEIEHACDRQCAQ